MSLKRDINRKGSAITIAGFDFKSSKSLLNEFASKVKNTFKGKKDGAVPSRARSTCTLNESSFHYDRNYFKNGDFTLPRNYGRRGSCKFVSAKEAIQASYTSDYSSNSSSSDSSPEMKRKYSEGAQTLGRSRRKHRSKPLKEESEKSTHENSKTKNVNLAILGAEGVGKSAFAVRYLTKRFIGEYVPETESIYDHTTTVSGKAVNLTLWETTIPENIKQTNSHSCEFVENRRPSLSSLSSSSISSISDGESSSKRASVAEKTKNNDLIPSNNCECISKVDERVKWADGIVVLYDICDQESFEYAKDLIHYIRRREHCGFGKRDSGVYSSNSSNAGSLPRARNNQKLHSVPIILIGNKSDLVYRRKVKSSLTSSVAYDNDCSFIEVSVSDSFMPIYNVVTGFVSSLPKLKSRNSLKNMVKSTRR